MKYIFSLIIVLAFNACSTKEELVLFYNDTNGASVDKDRAENVIPVRKVKFEYKIIPHDRISLIVYKHPEFSTSTTGAPSEDRGIVVDSDGYVSLPLVDDIHVAGLTQKEARVKIEKAFFNYLKYTKIKIEVLNKRAYIMGEVKKPGEIEFVNEKSSLLKMIAKAGDLTDYANRQNILILRDEGDQTKIRRVNLIDMHSIHMSSMMIYPNDIIYVAPKGEKAFNLKVNEYAPVFKLLGSVLTPFVNIKYLTD